MEMFDIPLRRIFQNLNCFSFMGRNMRKCINVYNIKICRSFLCAFLHEDEKQSLGTNRDTVSSSQLETPGRLPNMGGKLTDLVIW